MGFAALKQTAQTVCQMGEALSGADKECVAAFAFRTGDRELTNKLIDELTQPEADREAVYQRFNAMTDFQPDWIRSIENLLVSLELYRVREEKALKTLAEILSAYGIEVSEEEIREPAPERIGEYTDRAEGVQR
ncbi:MAG: hypothetical protein NC124_05500 [Clostridium sp.]|nr:hypothetical protein [Clostridium sp.]MCM1550063.1 hypothetical protein [Clostridium sp.]